MLLCPHYQLESLFVRAIFDKQSSRNRNLKKYLIFISILTVKQKKYGKKRIYIFKCIKIRLINQFSQYIYYFQSKWKSQKRYKIDRQKFVHVENNSVALWFYFCFTLTFFVEMDNLEPFYFKISFDAFLLHQRLLIFLYIISNPVNMSHLMVTNSRLQIILDLL